MESDSEDCPSQISPTSSYFHVRWRLEVVVMKSRIAQRSQLPVRNCLEPQHKMLFMAGGQAHGKNKDPRNRQLIVEMLRGYLKLTQMSSWYTCSYKPAVLYRGDLYTLLSCHGSKTFACKGVLCNFLIQTLDPIIRFSMMWNYRGYHFLYRSRGPGTPTKRFVEPHSVEIFLV